MAANYPQWKGVPVDGLDKGIFICGEFYDQEASTFRSAPFRNRFWFTFYRLYHKMPYFYQKSNYFIIRNSRFP